MARHPIGDAERQRKRRERLRQPRDAGSAPSETYQAQDCKVAVPEEGKRRIRDDLGETRACRGSKIH